jgi:hypothetical protein
MNTDVTRAGPTDLRYKRLRQAIQDLQDVLAGQPSVTELDGAVVSSEDTWKKYLPGLLSASRAGLATDAWAAAFDQLRILRSRAAALRMR